MESLSTRFLGFFDPMREGLKGLSFLQKMVIGVGFAGLFGAVAVMFAMQETKQYEYLFVDVSKSDTRDITRFLVQNGIEDFIADDKGVRVLVDRVNEVRLMLSKEGIPNQGVVGWEQFDKQDFTRTDFEQEIHRIRAIQGELSRTISSIDGISSARVHIVLPKTSLFIRDEKEPSAAIYLKHKRGFELDQKMIRGIQHLVSRSVEGLPPSNVTILDSNGRMLTEIETNDESIKQTKELLSYKQKIEKNLEDRILSIVGRIVGSERVEAKVDAEVDFTKEHQTISDVDPDDTATVSKNTSGFTMEGSGLNPTGIPGSKSNVPGEQEDLVVNQSKAGSKRETELINYEFSKTISQKTMAVGNITRLTISAIVDGKQAYPIDGSIPQFVARTPEEMVEIEAIIKNAVGFKGERGDLVKVSNLMFQLDPLQVIEIKNQKKEDREYIFALLAAMVAALGIIFSFAFIVRPYFRWLAYDPERKQKQAILEEYKPDLELGTMQSVHVQEDVPFDKLSPKEKVMYLARNEPKRTTEAIRMMLSPNQQQG